jgi:ferrochelatase
MSDHLPADHPFVQKPKIGVVLLNLGTPDATDYWSVRRYLKEFLSDQRVIETPKWLWWPILNLVILSVRPQKSGHAYEQIWDKEKNESPLRVITRNQTEALAARLAGHDDIVVDFAMRYGNPSTRSVLEKMQAAGCQKILLVPLYPQYSATTTATAIDRHSMPWPRCAGSLRCVPRRPISKMPNISRRWAIRSATGWLRWISSRTW